MLENAKCGMLRNEDKFVACLLKADKKLHPL